MEELNKNQIILLVLLVSFVTSIATGIVTVTLMDQAPQEVTRTINRVVERVVPGETKISTVVKEVPVIVTEEALIVEAINNGSPAVFRIFLNQGSDKKQIGSAIYVDKRGYFATESGIIPDNLSPDYVLVDEDGNEYKFELSSRNTKTALIKIKEESAISFQKFSANRVPIIMATNVVSVGQTVIGVGATAGGNHTVSVSIISSLSNLNNATSTLVSTNAATAENIGGPLLNIQGEAIGLNVTPGLAVSIREVKALLDSIK